MSPEDKDELIEVVEQRLAHYSGRSEITAEERKIVASLVHLIFLSRKAALEAMEALNNIRDIGTNNTVGLRSLHDALLKHHNALLKQLSGITRTNSERRAAADGAYQRYRAIAAELGNGKLSRHQRALRVQTKLKERGEHVACRTVERALKSKG